MRNLKLILRAALAAVITIALPAPATDAQSSRWTGGVTRVDTVAAPSLTGNLIGDPAWREATVYLPPGYSTNRSRRYPVVYLLHGFAADHRAFMKGAYQNLNVRISMDSLIRAGSVSGMIVVTPNARNFFDGSFYANSPVTGRWEDFIARDLIAHIDRRYRTVARRSGRGIAGHSMGGYGALRIAMDHPDKFSAVYALSPCCLSMSSMEPQARGAAWKAAVRLRDRSEYQKAGFTANLIYALAAVYSPNPDKPPFFADLPYRLEGETLVPVPEIAERWKMGPIAMVPLRLDALRRLSIALDAGTADGLTDIPVNVRVLDSLLTANKIPHAAELYEGTHGSRIRERIEAKVFPFFSRVLR